MKKIIAMLLVLVMSVTGLVGCGSSKDNEAGSTSASSDSDWAYIQDKENSLLVSHYLHQ